MEGFLSFEFEGVSSQTANVVVAMTIAVGTLYCFLGYRALKFLVCVTGFILAGATGAIFVDWLTGGNQLLTVIGAGLVGLVGAIAFFLLYKVGIFSVGLVAMALCAHNVIGSQEEWAPWAAAGIGILGGLLALAMERPVMILATSVIGAWVLVSGIGHFLLSSQFFLLDNGASDELKLYTTMLASWIALGFAGISAQFATRKRLRR